MTGNGVNCEEEENGIGVRRETEWRWGGSRNEVGFKGKCVMGVMEWEWV